ncbi:hypothetical protein MVEN_00095600 [Mycena venus]|uniref:Uncharacterized protein n=1 Tax=Mycena venus TaxID=2733690 RepID=A0A8H7DED2_9AGAR|nr:hypothetical protein MVEN_00095600 [Mycena venus]
MHALLDGSPVHDNAAYTNSNDSLDEKFPGIFNNAFDMETSQDDSSSVVVIDDDAESSSIADAASTFSDDYTAVPPAKRLSPSAVPTAKAAATKREKAAITKTEKTSANTKTVPKPIVAAAPKRKRDSMVDTLKDVVEKIRTKPPLLIWG